MEPDQLRSVLSKDERLEWWGRPPAGLILQSSDSYLIPFSLVWGGFAFFWEWSVFRQNGSFFFKLWGVPFVLIGVYLIIGRFFVDAVKRSRTLYGVTNQRILIYSGLVTASLRALDLRTLTEINIKLRSNGAGTISFGPPTTKAAFFGQESRPKFEMIAGAQGVYETIRNAQKQSYEAPPQSRW